MHLSSLIKRPVKQQLVVAGDREVNYSSSKRGVAKGFTLVEVLVVMAIIATLLGLGVGAIKSMATSKGVSTAVPLAEGIFAQARQVAKSSGVPTRVVIYADSSGDNADVRERYLRMMAVATGRDASGGPAEDEASVTEWRLISRPAILPSDTFFNASLSNKSAGPSEKALFPGSNSDKDCYVYEFNSEGALINANGGIVNDGQFVVQAGKLKPGATVPDAASNATRDIGGFRIWRNGRMSQFRSPNQIVSSAQDPEF